MKHVSTLSALLATGMLFTCFSCRVQESQTPNNIVALVDFSTSRNSAVVHWYKETVKDNIIQKMGSKDRFICLPIDYSSKTASQELFKVDFSLNDYSNEFAGLQKDETERENHRDSLTAAASQFSEAFDLIWRERSGNPIQGTDIFGALQQARKYMLSDHRNIVVLFSDMLQFTDKTTMNFEDRLNDTSEIAAYISRSPKVDLSGIVIVVLTGAQIEMRPEKFAIVQAFWERYFTENGANVLDYSSGAVDKLEQTITKQ